MKRPSVKDIKQGVTLYQGHGLGKNSYITQWFITKRPWIETIGLRFEAIRMAEWRVNGKGFSKSSLPNLSKHEKFVGDCGFEYHYGFGPYETVRRNQFAYKERARVHALFFTFKDAARYVQGIVNDPVQVAMEDERVQELWEDMKHFDRALDIYADDYEPDYEEELRAQHDRMDRLDEECHCSACEAHNADTEAMSVEDMEADADLMNALDSTLEIRKNDPIGNALAVEFARKYGLQEDDPKYSSGGTNGY